MRLVYVSFLRWVESAEVPCFRFFCWAVLACMTDPWVICVVVETAYVRTLIFEFDPTGL